MIKYCGKCKKYKQITEYYKCKSKKDGLNSCCKKCDYKKYRKRYQNKKQEILEKNKIWGINNKQKRKEHGKNWRKRNLSYDCYKVSLRKAKKLLATPKWLSKKQLDEIKEIYQMRQELNWLSEGGLHVDHIVPLQGKNVCGLHVPWNLQIIPASENLKKRNKYE